ncbi:MAG TPA: ATP-binding protein [Polyangiaceae bacterium]|nr:ATP-binding protein [Polyangiaceae bacterium]
MDDSNSAPTLRQLPNGRRAVAQLNIVKGPGLGHRFNVDAPLLMGRSPEATIVIEHEEISRIHARVWNTDGSSYYVEDLSSRNGTFLNGIRIERAPLCLGDRIRLGGEVELLFTSSDGLSDRLAERQRYETLGRLGVGAAHDLNQIVTAIMSSAAFLKETLLKDNLGKEPARDVRYGRERVDPDVQDCISDLVLAASRADRFAHSMLEFARGGRSQRTLLDLSALVGEALELLQPTLSSHILVQVRRARGVFVLGNSSELSQVLLSLGWNAVDAMPHGGSLNIETSVVDFIPKEINLPGAKRAALLSVTDTGVGMTEETQRRLFEPFFTTKAQGQGYGLGLASAHEIVTLHGGIIRVQSALARGTRVEVYLPAPDPDSLRRTETIERPLDRAPAPSPGRLLLVDEAGIVRRMLARLLRRSGFEVFEAGSIDECLHRLARDSIELAIIDSKVQHRSGPDTPARLASARPGLKLIFAANGTDGAALSDGQPRDDLAILQKPFAFEQLLMSIERLLGLPSRR